MRRFSGTKSNVCFILSGETSDTGMLELKDKHKRVCVLVHKQRIQEVFWNILKSNHSCCARTPLCVYVCVCISVVRDRVYLFNTNSHTNLQEFSTGSIRNFILATEQPLGHLVFLRIWHDNSGKGNHASWFIDKILIEDLQTKLK